MKELIKHKLEPSVVRRFLLAVCAGGLVVLCFYWLTASLQMAQADASDLSAFLAEQVLPHLPSDAVKKVREAKIRIHTHFNDELPSDGLFVPASELKQTTFNLPGDGRELHLFLRNSVLKSGNGYPILVHEFFHAVHYLLNPNEELWVREGLAQEFETIVLGRMNGIHAAAALQDLSTPLLFAEQDLGKERVVPAVYGHSFFYFHYLSAQCGGESTIWEIARGAYGKGAKGIDVVLKRTERASPCRSFEESVVHFEIARALNAVTYGKGAPSRVHYLMSTTLPQATPLAQLDEQRWQVSSSFTPFLLESNARLNSPVLAQSWVYLLEKKFPNRVLSYDVRPADLSGWNMLVIKK